MKKTIISIFSSIILLFSFNASAVTEITWWDLYGGGDGEKLQNMVDAFNKDHPEINITKTTQEWGPPFYAKLEMSSAIGEQPDIALYHMSRIQMAKGTNVFTPLTIEELASVGIHEEDYYPAFWNKGKGDEEGTMYVVPFDSPVVIFHWNKTLMEKAGLVDDNGLFSTCEGSPEKFISCLDALKAIGVEQPISARTDNAYMNYWWFLSLVKQFGGEIWTEEGGWCPDDGCKKATEFYAGLVTGGYMPGGIGEDSYNGFLSGNHAIHVNGGWAMSPVIEKSRNATLGFEYAVTKVPQLGADNGILAAHVHASGFMIPNSDKNPISEEKKQIGLQIIGWMAKNNLYWATAGHYIPYKPTANSLMYNALWPSSTYADIGEIAFFEPNHPVFGIAGPIYDVLGSWIVGAINGDISADEFVENTQMEINAIVDSM